MKYIVITSINPPNQVVRNYSKMSGSKVLVVGDKKTPDNYRVTNVDYLSIKNQTKYKIHKMLPYNHYCRKNIGYIHAIKNSASEIVDTDDDNYPYKDISSCPQFGISQHNTPVNKDIWCNIYQYFTERKCWPRGFPLDELKKEKCDLEVSPMNVVVWQGLVDLDPDVDAIYRMTTKNPEFNFDKQPPLALSHDQFCPTNSQNTTFSKKAFPLLYLPHTVSFRFTDILRGLVMQQILGVYKLSVGFHNATVYQKRNKHDLMEDFESEIPIYLQSKKIPHIVRSVIKPTYSMEDNLLLSYQVLERNKIVKHDEINTLTTFLEEIS